MRDLAREPGERDHRAEHAAAGGDLAAVVMGVRGGRHDQQRAAVGRGGVGAEDLPGLGRVGGSEYERQRHAPDNKDRTGACAGPRVGACADPAGGACATGSSRFGRALLDFGGLRALLRPRLVELDAPLAVLGLLQRELGAEAACPSGP